MTERPLAALPDALEIRVARQIGEIILRLDLHMGPGVTTMVGPSGAGKSTALRLVAGLLKPDAGSIRLGETLLDDTARRYHLPPGRRDIGLVFQEYALFPHLTVAENVAYGLRARRVPGAERRTRVARILERLRIGSLAAERPGRLSGGQRQRVALARALVTGPRALLLDEPLAALDVQTRAAVRGELRTVLADLAIPTLLVTHDYADAVVFRERIVILVAGQVVQDGSHEELLARPRSRFVADFTGINWFDGELLARQPGQTGRIRLEGGLEIAAPAEELDIGPVAVSLRPWEVTLTAAPPDGSARNVLPGRVREVLALGGRVRVSLALGEGGALPLVAEITSEAQEALGCHQGQALYASFKATTVGVAPR